jgi:hypothetical protein
MSPRLHGSPRIAAWAALGVLGWTALGGTGSAAAPSGTGPERFPSAQAAAEALGRAWTDGHTAALIKVFGAQGSLLAVSGDKVEDAASRKRLAAAFAADHRLEAEGSGREILVMGPEAWPYPIPIVRQGGAWAFDVKAGEKQILDRRIGRNELAAMETCRAFVSAEREFAASPAGGGAYARKVQSSPGAHDGLYWDAASGEAESPLGPRVALAEAKGYGEASRLGVAPFQGYAFRILTGQGRHAPGGPKSYLKGERMTDGFALLAWPAKWGDSGVMTFAVSRAGIIFEKNLGPQTARVARQIEAFDPDPTWKIAGSAHR